MSQSTHLPQTPESRWQVLAGTVAAAGLFFALPSGWLPGPQWCLLAVVTPLGIGGWITHRLGKRTWNDALGYTSAAVLTLGLVLALAALMRALPTHKETALQLLQSAAVLWLTNIVVFAVWYWRLDAGGPNARHERGDHEEGAFLFPQMTLEGGTENWRPQFIDYLFLAFNTSTAFSPTDTAPLSRWAKSLMMIQSMISLTTVAILAGRAVNIL